MVGMKKLFLITSLLFCSVSYGQDNYLPPKDLVNMFEDMLECSDYEQTIFGFGKEKLRETNILIGLTPSPEKKILNGVIQKYKNIVLIKKATFELDYIDVCLTPTEILSGRQYLNQECTFIVEGSLSRKTLEGSIGINSGLKCKVINKTRYLDVLSIIAKSYLNDVSKNKL